MVESKRPVEIIALGKRIVEELGVHESVDTLCKWMAHFLAESINEVENEPNPKRKAKAEQRCFELILRVWNSRTNLHRNARPTGRIEEAIDSLAAMEQVRSFSAQYLTEDKNKQSNHWLTFARKSYANDKRMAAISILAGVLENDFGAERRWLEDHGSQLSDEEKELIDLLDKQLGTKLEWVTRDDKQSVASLSPKDRNVAILKEINALVEAQNAALSDLKESLNSTAD